MKCEIGDCEREATWRVFHHAYDDKERRGLLMNVCEPCRLQFYIEYSYKPLDKSVDTGAVLQ